MKSFLINLGHLFALILLSTGIMFGIRCLFEPHQSLNENLGCAAALGVIIGAMAYYRAKR